MHIWKYGNTSLFALFLLGLIAGAVALQSTLGFAMDSFASPESLELTDLMDSADVQETDARMLSEPASDSVAPTEPTESESSDGYAGTEMPEETLNTESEADPEAACDPCDSGAECFDGCDPSCAPDYCDENGGCHMPSLCTATASTSSPMIEIGTIEAPTGTSTTPSPANMVDPAITTTEPAKAVIDEQPTDTVTPQPAESLDANLPAEPATGTIPERAEIPNDPRPTAEFNRPPLPLQVDDSAGSEPKVRDEPIPAPALIQRNRDINEHNQEERQLPKLKETEPEAPTLDAMPETVTEQPRESVLTKAVVAPVVSMFDDIKVLLLLILLLFQ